MIWVGCSRIHEGRRRRKEKKKTMRTAYMVVLAAARFERGLGATKRRPC